LFYNKFNKDISKGTKIVFIPVNHMIALSVFLSFCSNAAPLRKNH